MDITWKNMRVIELCKQRFYWPGYEKDIIHYIRKKIKRVKDKNPINSKQHTIRTSLHTNHFS